MAEHPPDEFETERLVVRAMREDDLEALLGVYLSNPAYLELTEGSGGEPGRYDLDMLQRDVAIAEMTPGRQMSGLFLRESGELVGVLDWMEEHPADGKPWVGLVMIRADRQRRGLAAEALEGFCDALRARGAPRVRAGVIERNRGGLALAVRLGFEAVSATVERMASEEKVIVVERLL